MSARSMLAFALVAAAITGGCDDERGGSSAPGEREVSAQGVPPATAPPMSSDCDMSGMDMSEMSTEEHHKMMDDCARRQLSAP